MRRASPSGLPIVSRCQAPRVPTSLGSAFELLFGNRLRSTNVSSRFGGSDSRRAGNGVGAIALSFCGVRLTGGVGTLCGP